MKEIRDIVSAYNEAQKQGLRAALATVVRVQGSAYRKAGARMLIAEDGKLTGAVSGGCLDGHLLRKALLVMAELKPILVTYESNDDDDGGARLGCNGVIDVFIEPLIDGHPANPLLLLKHMLLHRGKAVVTTIFSSGNCFAGTPGTSLLYYNKEKTVSNISSTTINDTLIADAGNVFTSKAPAVISYTFNENDTFKAFFDYIEPPVSLIIVGAGNDAIPLAMMANVLGWQSTIVDGRANYATHARFPAAQKVICMKPGKILPAVAIDERTVFVLMTHNYDYDLATLSQLLFKDIPYIGILGPKKKEEKLFGDLKDKGISLTPEQKSRIFGPTGLDIGAETPEEIALSIIAEIKKVLGRGNGTSLRDKKKNIHALSDEEMPVLVF